MSEGLE